MMTSRKRSLIMNRKGESPRVLDDMTGCGSCSDDNKRIKTDPENSEGQQNTAERALVVKRRMDFLAASDAVSETHLRSRASRLHRKSFCREEGGLICSAPCTRPQLIDSVLRSMERHVRVIEVQVEGAHLLQQSIPWWSENEIDRIMAVLFRSLTHHFSNATFFVLALDLFRPIKHRRPDVSHWLAAVWPVLNGLEHYKQNSSIQRRALSLVAWWAEDCSSRLILLQVRAVEILFQSMACHIDDSYIHCEAAAALCWLIHAGPSDFPSSHVPIIVDSVKRHQDTPSTFGNAVCLLCGLPSQLQSEASTGLFSTILQGMQRHEKSSQVQESCLRWLRQRRRTPEEWHQAIPRVITALRLHSDHGHLQAQGVEVFITMMRQHEEIKVNLLKEGTVDIVLKMVQQHANNVKVQEGALWFFSMTLTLESPSTIAFGGGWEVIEAIWISGQRADGIDPNELAEVHHHAAESQ